MKKNLASAAIALAVATGFLQFRTDKSFEESLKTNTTENASTDDPDPKPLCCKPTELCCE